ncbi:MAG: hypothetical protein AAGD14_15825 [Planctomycetota bacterium]
MRWAVAVFVVLGLIVWSSWEPTRRRRVAPRAVPLPAPVDRVVPKQPESPPPPKLAEIPREERRKAFPELDDASFEGFDEKVLEPLGRLPQGETRSALLEAWQANNRPINSAGWMPEPTYFFEQLQGRIARSDFLLLWYSNEWQYRFDGWPEAPSFEPGPQPGADPYLNPAHFQTHERFWPWYRAYHEQLELPALDRDQIRDFHARWVDAMGRLPSPDLMRDGFAQLRAYDARLRELDETYGEYPTFTAIDERIEAEIAVATRALFAHVRKRAPEAYRHMLHSDYWDHETDKAGLQER